MFRSQEKVDGGVSHYFEGYCVKDGMDSGRMRPAGKPQKEKLREA